MLKEVQEMAKRNYDLTRTFGGRWRSEHTLRWPEAWVCSLGSAGGRAECYKCYSI